MRISLLILACVLSSTAPVAAQWSGAPIPGAPAGPAQPNARVALGGAAGRTQLERAAAMGDRRAAALLAVLLQDTPETAGSLLRSALYLQLAIAAGCSDLDTIADQAAARLSPEDRAAYELAQSRWVADTVPVAAAASGRCLSWLAP